MGGNALKEFGNVRLDAETYHSLCRDLVGYLSEYGEVRVVKSIRNKESFGDVDILFSPKYKIDMTPYFVENLHTTLKYYQTNVRYSAPNDPIIKLNGPVTSIGIHFESGDIFQLDLIKTPFEGLEFADGYFAWNDCGNLIGRIAHKMGLKFGHDGLKLPVRNGNELLGEIVLTTDFKEALDFLKFDYSRWLKGFDELEDMFEFIVNNPRFNPTTYLLENRNHTARMRDRKRPSYTKFLEYIKNLDDSRRYYEWNTNKGDYLAEIFTKFPNALNEWTQLLTKCVLHNRTKTKYNGNVVMEATGLSGKELSQFMTEFNIFVDEYVDNFWNYIDRASSQNIITMIKLFHGGFWKK
jgi:hypothetical protein